MAEVPEQHVEEESTSGGAFDMRSHLEASSLRVLVATLSGALTGGLIGFSRAQAHAASNPIVIPKKEPTGQEKFRAKQLMYRGMSKELGKAAVLAGTKIGMLATLFCAVELSLARGRQVGQDDMANLTVAGLVTGAVAGGVQGRARGMGLGALVGAGTAAVFAFATRSATKATASIRQEVDEEMQARRAAREAERERREAKAMEEQEMRLAAKFQQRQADE